MAERARVGSVEALRSFKPSVVRFAEQTQAALGAAEHRAYRTHAWLVHERRPELERQARRLQEELSRVRSKIASQTNPHDGKPRPKVDDQIEYDRIKRQLQRVEEQRQAARKWARLLEQALEEYKGSVSQLGWFVRSELGRAVGALDQMGDALDAYAQIRSAPRSAQIPAPQSHTHDQDTSSAGHAPPDTNTDTNGQESPS